MEKAAWETEVELKEQQQRANLALARSYQGLAPSEALNMLLKKIEDLGQEISAIYRKHLP